MKEKNACYYRGAEERNEQRQALIAQPELLKEVLAVAKLHKKFQKEFSELKDKLDYRIESEALKLTGLDKA